ncbi:MAG: hypothetical protein GVY02_08580 [Bacteroidetes bacterium]|jgi:hypothetical protein|nr:hypothetical protein [Bacteroidota bacterium]
MRAFLILLVFSWLSTLFLPWWGIVIPGVIVGAWLLEKNVRSFLIGFAAAGLAWFFQALYIDIANDSILSNRIAEMVGLQSNLLILGITFLVAAILGGFSALTGTSLKQALKPAATIKKG